MKFYTFGDKGNPAFLTLPGTICYWNVGFGDYLEQLARRFYVVCVSYDGFDETEDTIYPDMQTEAEKIERYVRDNLNNSVFCIYGCSLGGSYAAYLLQRGKIRIRHIILGSSDMDQASGLSARLQSKLVTGFMYGLIRKGSLPGWMRKLSERKLKKDPDLREYMEKFMGIYADRENGGAKLSFVKKESVYNQFYSDLVTRIEDGISVPGTSVHIFYAKKMGEKYLQRYLRHFAAPDIRTQDMQHEEMFFCHRELWLKEVLSCCGMKETPLPGTAAAGEGRL